VIIDTEEPLAIAVVEAIHVGDVEALRRLLAENPGLANAQLGGDPDNKGDGGMTRSLLHVATDWPGHFPNVTATVATLLDAGAEVDARFTGPHNETPLHWAASSDDAEVAAALIEGGADIEAAGGSIAETPLDNAVGYGCWHVARLLVSRGARVDKLWHAAALGQLARLEALIAGSPTPTPEDIDEAFWQACHGGQRRTAE
jgi:hypothetical protein